MAASNNTNRYTGMIHDQKQILQKAKRLQGQHPHCLKTREDTGIRFLLALAAGDQHVSFVPPAYPPCTTPLAELRPVTTRCLRLETHHRGTYILLRATVGPSRMHGIMTLAEDVCDDAVMLHLYHQEAEDREPTDIVDVGTILLVKEPYFTIMESGQYGIRVDHLSDVIHVDKGNPMIPGAWRPPVLGAGLSAESLRFRGDSAVRAHKYWEAIKAYSAALSHPATPQEIKVIKRNRSIAFLKTKQFDAALSDTGFPNFGPNPAQKALFRAASALYSLERFSTCCKVLRRLLTKFPNNSAALRMLARARCRLSEQNNGVYDFGLLQEEARELRPPHLDHATYIGPVEVKQTGHRGRGLFVTKPVKAGALLLCEKAFAHAYIPEGDEASPSVTFLTNHETKQIFVGAQADLLRIIVHKLYRNPSLAPRLTALYRETYEPVNTLAVDGKPIVDTFLAERIMAANAFNCPVSSLNTHRNILVHNCAGSARFLSCGIWPRASHINHSCMSTARRSFIGDMMIVRATKDLDPGTEVTFWYPSPNCTGCADFPVMLRGRRFECGCVMCQDARETEPNAFKKRQKWLEVLDLQCGSSPPILDIEKYERLLRALHRSYSRPAVQVPRILLWEPQLLLARVYMARDDMPKCLEAVSQLLTTLGFVTVGFDSSPTRFRVVQWGWVIQQLVETFMAARLIFEAMGSYEDGRLALGYAVLVHRMCVGEDESFVATLRALRER